MRHAALIAAVLLAAPSSQAQSPGLGDFGYKHAENHEWYGRELPSSCCHDGDCRETIARYTPAGWLALVDGSWIEIPDRTIIRNPDGTPKASKDHKAHVCASKFTQAIFCFLPPEEES